MRRVVLPQATRVIIPPIGNEFIGLLKTSSLASVITYSELMFQAERIYEYNTRIMEMLICCDLLVSGDGVGIQRRSVLPGAPVR